MYKHLNWFSFHHPINCRAAVKKIAGWATSSKEPMPAYGQVLHPAGRGVYV